MSHQFTIRRHAFRTKSDLIANIVLHALRLFSRDYSFISKHYPRG